MEKAQPRKLMKSLATSTLNFRVSKATPKQTAKMAKDSLRNIPRSGSNPTQN